MTSDLPGWDTPDPPPRKTYPQFETLIFRALQLRCPRCGKGKLFQGWFRMNDRCPVCRLQIERPSGYYLGSMYVNYGMTAWITTISFIVGRYVFNLPGSVLVWPLGAFCLLFPTFFFRYSRALWLALDCQFDRSVLDENDDNESNFPQP